MEENNPPNPDPPKKKRGQMTVEKILELQKTLRTDKKIGQFFGLTRQAVYNFRKLCFIPIVENKNKIRDEEIYRKYLNGVSGKRVAGIFNLGYATVYRIINQQKKLQNQNEEKKIKSESEDSL